MTIKDMHYDFKQKLNKIDSQQNRELYVPEIDWKLNEAYELFVKIIAQPRIADRIGFEINQRTIDDIRTLVVDSIDSTEISKFDETSYSAKLPIDYWFYANSTIYAKKDTCPIAKMREIRIVQHDDRHEQSPFNRSSFEWREVNVRFNSGGLRVFTDGTFSIEKVLFEYVRQPEYIHNAEDWKTGTYKLLDGTELKGTQDCKLPSTVHREIVNLAVMLTAGDLNLPEYMLKKERVNIDQLS